MGESKLDEAFHAMFEMAGIRRQSAIRSYARELGPASVRAMYDWANSHVVARTGVDIQWRREHLVRATLLTQQPELEELSAVIRESSDEETSDIVVEGELVGCDVLRRSFHFKPTDGADMSGRFTDAISLSQSAEVPKRYQAKITMTRRTFFATGEEQLHYHLNHLESLH
ncbi:MAG: hypothetical protein IIC97_12450 [Chloroflexi bacterium]|nr:hypothetical protein [Chloroflexota bacterium]